MLFENKSEGAAFCPGGQCVGRRPIAPEAALSRPGAIRALASAIAKRRRSAAVSQYAFAVALLPGAPLRALRRAMRATFRASPA